MKRICLISMCGLLLSIIGCSGKTAYNQDFNQSSADYYSEGFYEDPNERVVDQIKFSI